MSRTKTESVETLSTETVVEPVTEITPAETKVEETKTVEPTPAAVMTATTTKKEKKMGLEFFLQKHPQTYEVATLMRSKYSKSVMKESEWLVTLDYILNKKVIN